MQEAARLLDALYQGLKRLGDVRVEVGPGDTMVFVGAVELKAGAAVLEVRFFPHPLQGWDVDASVSLPRVVRMSEKPCVDSLRGLGFVTEILQGEAGPLTGGEYAMLVQHVRALYARGR